MRDSLFGLVAREAIAVRKSSRWDEWFETQWFRFVKWYDDHSEFTPDPNQAKAGWNWLSRRIEDWFDAVDQGYVRPSSHWEYAIPEYGDDGLVTGWVSWGYEMHDFKIGYARWRRIRAGHAVVVRSTGWYEGKSFPCRWYFDLKEENSLVVDYGDDGGQGFVGQILDAHIEENAQKTGTNSTRDPMQPAIDAYERQGCELAIAARLAAQRASMTASDL